MTPGGDRDPRVDPFPKPKITRPDPNPTPQHCFSCGGLVVVCPEKRELVTWSIVNDPDRW